MGDTMKSENCEHKSNASVNAVSSGIYTKFGALFNGIVPDDRVQCQIEQECEGQMNNFFKSTISNDSCNNRKFDLAEAKSSLDILGPKAEMVYSLLTMLGSNNRLESSETFLLMSNDKEANQLLRKSGCLTLLIQLIHSQDDVTSSRPTEEDLEIMDRASFALRNFVVNQNDEKQKKLELTILQQLEILRRHVLTVRLKICDVSSPLEIIYSKDVLVAIAALVKYSFDEEYRRVTLELGGLQAVAEILIIDQLSMATTCNNSTVEFRKNIGMALTNLTFGAVQGKKLLCQYPRFLETVNKQVQSQFDGLRLVFSGVLRNLSWKAERTSKLCLRSSGAIQSLAEVACRRDNSESTLKSILSALWNLSAHCTENKGDICSVPGFLQFLVNCLRYEVDYDDTLPQRMAILEFIAILENGGGILRYVSSHVAKIEEHRLTLRRNNCFQTLLSHLKSSSLTVVGNACGTLWNLSAHSYEDQQHLWQLGAVDCLRHLAHSKHKLISLGSTATLKNLQWSHPQTFSNSTHSESIPSVRTKPASVTLPYNSKGTIAHCEVSSSTSHLSVASEDCSLMPQAHCYNLGIEPSSANSSDSSALQGNRPITQRLQSNLGHKMPQNATSASGRRQKSLHGCNDTRSYSVESEPLIHPLSVAYHSQNQRPVKPLGVRFNVPSAGRSASPHQRGRPFIGPIANDAVGDESSDETVKIYAYEGVLSLQASQFSSVGDLGSIQNDEKQVVGDASAISTSQNQAALTKVQVVQCAVDAASKNNSKPITCNPTPLMFSRHSSLQSLTSCCDQQSLQSACSEYSQLPTGGQSPSDLPDSPNHSCPSTPATQKVDPGKISKTQTLSKQERTDIEECIYSALPKPKKGRATATFI